MPFTGVMVEAEEEVVSWVAGPVVVIVVVVKSISQLMLVTETLPFLVVPPGEAIVVVVGRLD